MSAHTVTITKKKYEELLEKQLRYERIRQVLEENTFSSPPIRNSREIIKKFAATKRYNKKFLTRMAKGLKRSAYFQS